MHFLKSLVGAVAALAATAAAQSLAFTSTPTNVEVLTPVTLTYTAPDLSAPVTITLLQGDPSNPQTVQVLTTTATGGSWTWNPVYSLVSGTNYALSITQGSDTSYSGQIVLNGGQEPGEASSTLPSYSTMSISYSTTPQIYTTAYSATSTAPVIYSTTSYVPTTSVLPPGPTVIVPPANTTVVVPPANTTVPSPPPFQGAAGRAVVASSSAALALFAGFVLFL